MLRTLPTNGRQISARPGHRQDDTLERGSVEPDRFTELYRRHHRAVWEDLAVRDVALVLDCSPNAVSLRLARARKRLGRELAHLMTVPYEERRAR
jgi:hypothetical protein